MRLTVSKRPAGRFFRAEQFMKQSAKVTLEVFVPMALKRSSGMVSRAVHSANVPSNVVTARSAGEKA